MLQEFKKFALKGNMIDLAVGIIIGSAFNGIVNSLVNDIVMPLLSVFTKKIDFSKLFFTMDGKHYDTLEAAEAANAAAVKYGAFITGLLNFIILAFVVFIIVKWLNKLKRPEQAAAPTTKKCPACLSDINIKATRCPYCTSEVPAEQ